MGVVIVDPDVMSSKLLQFVLETAGHEDIEVALHGAHALNLVKDRDVNLLVLEVDLPDMTGYELCKSVRDQRYKGPLIFVANRSTSPERVHALRIGADDFIAKPIYPQEFIARVEAVARRHGQQDYQALGTLLKVGDAELSITDLKFRIPGREVISLTPTEMRILECLMRNSNITISRETLIERTWGFDFFGDSNRVDVYIRRLRSKIESDQSRPEYLHTVRRVGYVFRPPVRSKKVRTDAVVSTLPARDLSVPFDVDLDQVVGLF